MYFHSIKAMLYWINSISFDSIFPLFLVSKLWFCPGLLCFTSAFLIHASIMFQPMSKTFLIPANLDTVVCWTDDLCNNLVLIKTLQLGFCLTSAFLGASLSLCLEHSGVKKQQHSPASLPMSAGLLFHNHCAVSFLMENNDGNNELKLNQLHKAEWMLQVQANSHSITSSTFHLHTIPSHCIY